jgi:hypothetical protein
MVFLTDLDLNGQTSDSPRQARHIIRQNVRSQDTVSVSLAGAIYDGAGRPQGMYSCLVLTDVRYRVGDEWLNKTIDACSVEMAALTPIGVRRLRGYQKNPRASIPRGLRSPQSEQER